MRRLAILLSFCAYGQTYDAQITGIVRDSNGSAVPSAVITVRQTETDVARKAKSAASGVYSVPLLLPGSYEVTVEAAGMEALVCREIKLEINSAAIVDFTLNVAPVRTVVDVPAEVPVLQSQTSGAASTLETRLVQDYPLVERDAMGLVRAMPGIVASPMVGLARSSRNVFDSTFSVAGGRSSTNDVLLDGSATTIGDFNGLVVVPPQDSVQEFRVETSSYSAVFGRTGGGVVNIVTKAGTNTYHGTAFYYQQNDALNANSFVNNREGIPRLFLRRHQYGFNLGGPLWIPKLYRGKNKAFFFSAFDGRRESNPADQLASVPTSAQISGDLSHTVTLVNGQPQQIAIYDPATSRVVDGIRSRTLFPDNIIPTYRLNPVARAVLGYYPAPNLPGSPVTGLFNYRFHGTERYSPDMVSNRVDEYVGARQRLFVRFNLQDNLDKNPATMVRFVNTNSAWDQFKNFALDDTWQATSRLNNVFRYSYTRFHANLIPNSLGFDPTTIGLPAYLRNSANVLFFPNFNIPGPFPSLSGGYNNQPRDTQAVQETFVDLRGRHNLKGGAEYRLLRFYPFQVLNATGGFKLQPRLHAIRSAGRSFRGSGL